MSESAWLAFVAGMGIAGTLLSAAFASWRADIRLEKQARVDKALFDADRKRTVQQNMLSIVEDHLASIEVAVAKWQVVVAFEKDTTADAFEEELEDILSGARRADSACETLLGEANWRKPLNELRDQMLDLLAHAVAKSKEQFKKTHDGYASNIHTVRIALNRVALTGDSAS